MLMNIIVSGLYHASQDILPLPSSHLTFAQDQGSKAGKVWHRERKREAQVPWRSFFGEKALPQFNFIGSCLEKVVERSAALSPVLLLAKLCTEEAEVVDVFILPVAPSLAEQAVNVGAIHKRAGLYGGSVAVRCLIVVKVTAPANAKHAFNLWHITVRHPKGAMPTT